MPKNEKERAVRTLEDTFDAEKAKVDHLDVLNGFWSILCTKLSNHGHHPEKMVRIGDSTNSLSLNVGVSADSRGRGSIQGIHTAEFAKNALIEIEKYRVIFHPKEQGAYKVVGQFSVEPNVYAISYDGEPIFKVEISPSLWAMRPMTIEDYEGMCSFRYVPELDERPRKLGLKTSVPKKAKTEKEKLYKQIFLEFHRKLREKCMKIGMAPVAE